MRWIMSTRTTSSAPKLQASTILGAYRSIAAVKISCGGLASNDFPQAFKSSGDNLVIEFLLRSPTKRGGRTLPTACLSCPAHPRYAHAVSSELARLYPRPCTSKGTPPAASLHFFDQHPIMCRRRLESLFEEDLVSVIFQTHRHILNRFSCIEPDLQLLASIHHFEFQLRLYIVERAGHTTKIIDRRAFRCRSRSHRCNVLSRRHNRLEDRRRFGLCCKLQIFPHSLCRCAAGIDIALRKSQFRLGKIRGGLFWSQVCHEFSKLTIHGWHNALGCQSLFEFPQGFRIGRRINPLCHQQGLRRSQDCPIRLIHGNRVLMFLDQESCLIQFLIRFEDAIFDHFEGTASTFSRSEIFEHEFFVSLPVVVEGWVLFVGRHNSVWNQLILQFVLPHSIDISRQAFSRLAIPPVHLDQMRDGSRNTLRRQLDSHLTNLGCPVHFPTQMQLIMRCNTIADTLPHSV